MPETAFAQNDELQLKEKVTLLNFPRGFLRITDDTYEISTSGQSWIKISPEHGDRIQSTWHAQENARRNPNSIDATKFTHMNCRKTAFFISGEMSAAEALNDKIDVHGTAFLIQDVDTLTQDGIKANVAEDQYTAVRNQLDTIDSFPMLVHTFAFNKKDAIQMDLFLEMLGDELEMADISKMLYAYHTFIVEGKDPVTGEYICVHKHASGFEPVELIALKDALKSVDFQASLDPAEQERIPFSFMRPLTS